MVAASAYFFTKQLDLFAHETDQALALAPYDAEILAALACMISSAGDHQRGVALAKKANALNADAARGWYHSTVYTAYYLDGDYARALEVARQNTQQEMFYSYLEIIPIYGQLGMKQEALEAWHNLRKVLPSPSAQTFENWWRSVEYSRRGGRQADGRRLQIRRARSGREARPVTWRQLACAAGMNGGGRTMRAWR